MVELVRNELDFILRRIKIAVAHSGGTPLTSIRIDVQGNIITDPNVPSTPAVPTVLSPCGLRTVDEGRPMAERTRRANARKSAARAAVEHVFACQKGPMGLMNRTIGLARARARVPAAASEALGQLAELVAARRTPLRDRTATINRAKTLGLELLKRQAALRLKHIARQLDGLGACARGLVAADPLLARRFAVLTSIPGIGEATAAALIVDMPELGRMGAKQAASLAGLAPVSPGPGAARARSAAAAPTCVRRSTCRPWSPPASTRASKQGSPP